MPTPVSARLCWQENVSLADILSLRDSGLSEQEAWAVCLECSLSMRSVAHSAIFQTLCITPDTLAFNTNGNVCFMEQLSGEAPPRAGQSHSPGVPMGSPALSVQALFLGAGLCSPVTRPSVGQGGPAALTTGRTGLAPPPAPGPAVNGVQGHLHPREDPSGGAWCFGSLWSHVPSLAGKEVVFPPLRDRKQNPPLESAGPGSAPHPEPPPRAGV